jgi:5-methylcytosine-specific restriction protein B
VAGAYYYAPELELGQRRPVEWDDLTPRMGVPARGSSRGLVEMERTAFEQAASAPPMTKVVKPAPQAAPAVGQASQVGERAAVYRAERTTLQPVYTLADCADETGLRLDLLARWVQAIERKGQAILYGPPGTGKTFVAQRLARHLVSPSDENVGDGFVEVVQFHPAYSYEDFVQGIRPQTGPEGLRYAMTPGHFLNFCRRAVGRQGRCVLVIDEINRANLAQVFGELMYLLEYREETVALAGDGAPFAIPANVRLLGTMNTADRSLALVDHALRRRFAFLPLYPDLDLLRRYHGRVQSGFPVEGLAVLLGRINHAIGDRNVALGMAYFLRPDLAEQMESIWQLEIEPALEELFFDQPEQVEPFRWAAVRGGLGL